MSRPRPVESNIVAPPSWLNLEISQINQLPNWLSAINILLPTAHEIACPLFRRKALKRLLEKQLANLSVFLLIAKLASKRHETRNEKKSTSSPMHQADVTSVTKRFLCLCELVPGFPVNCSFFQALVISKTRLISAWTWLLFWHIQLWTSEFWHNEISVVFYWLFYSSRRFGQKFQNYCLRAKVEWEHLSRTFLT